ncbi:MAG: hypothetical protein ACT4NL_14720 [Pseudomarimonas sp.]
MKASANLRHRMPMDRCCNCDARTQLQPVAMLFPLSQVAMPDSERWSLSVSAPFCPPCLRSAGRSPPAWAALLLIGFLFFVLLLFGWLQVMPGASVDVEIRLLVSALLGFGIPLCVRWLPKKDRLQSSFWRPLRVTFDRAEAARGDLQTLTFEFTSPSFANAFAMLNSKVLQAGALKVKQVR